MAPAAVALVPARAGSERVAHKNVKPLAGHPADRLHHRRGPPERSLRRDRRVDRLGGDRGGGHSLWGRGAGPAPGRDGHGHVARTSSGCATRSSCSATRGRDYELFSILRPTSPFRGPHTIVRGFDLLLRHGEDADSVRAVERCRQHPGKMWTMDGAFMRPLLPQPEGVPLHSRQYKALPEVFVQDSSLEIAWTRVVTEDDDIAGRRIVPLVSEGVEGFSIDYPDDWERAERLVATGEGTLPEVEAPAESPAPR